MQGVLGVLQVWYCVEETQGLWLIIIKSRCAGIRYRKAISTRMKEKVDSFDVICGDCKL
jgi:hypothetical protein